MIRVNIGSLCLQIEQVEKIWLLRLGSLLKSFESPAFCPRCLYRPWNKRDQAHQRLSKDQGGASTSFSWQGPSVVYSTLLWLGQPIFLCLNQRLLLSRSETVTLPLSRSETNIIFFVGILSFTWYFFAPNYFTFSLCYFLNSQSKQWEQEKNVWHFICSCQTPDSVHSP